MRKHFGIFALALVAALVAFLPAPAQANLIVNPGFEQPVAGVGSGFQVYATITGWYATAGEGIEIQYGGVAGAPHSGNQHVELDSHPSGPSSNSGMAQDVATTAGLEYTLSFFYSPRPNQPETTNGIDVYWDGLPIASITGTGGADTSWTQYTYTVLGGGGSTTQLRFQAVGTPDTLGGYLDDVSLEPVPEPATLLLLGGGLTGLALRRRRRS